MMMRKSKERRRKKKKPFYVSTQKEKGKEFAKKREK
jgi:hypothetical protein